MASKLVKYPISKVNIDIMQSDEDRCIALAKNGEHEELNAAISGMIAFTKSVMNNEPRTFKDSQGYITKSVALFYPNTVK